MDEHEDSMVPLVEYASAPSLVKITKTVFVNYNKAFL